MSDYLIAPIKKKENLVSKKSKENLMSKKGNFCNHSNNQYTLGLGEFE